MKHAGWLLTAWCLCVPGLTGCGNSDGDDAETETTATDQPPSLQEFVEDLKKRSGLKKAVVTVRGWQKWGHDHHYPSLLPPNIDCGGYPEFQRLAQSVRD